jgi:hypothetical protein
LKEQRFGLVACGKKSFRTWSHYSTTNLNSYFFMKQNDFGALVISLDFELLWGMIGQTDYNNNLLGAKVAAIEILNLFCEMDIAATWGIVGFLFAKNRQELNFFLSRKKQLYDIVKKTYQEDMIDLFFAPEIIEMIKKTKMQEIGSHTFSHYLALDEKSKKEFYLDIKDSVRIARMHDIETISLIFPKNQVNQDYMDILVQHKIKAYRGYHNKWPFYPTSLYEHPNITKCKRLIRFIDRYIPLTGDNTINFNDIPEENGLYNVSESRILSSYNKTLFFLETLRLRRICYGIHMAAINNKIYHLWWHPHNFGINLHENISFLIKILNFFKECSYKYGMKSMSMKDIYTFISNRY